MGSAGGSIIATTISTQPETTSARVPSAGPRSKADGSPAGPLAPCACPADPVDGSAAESAAVILAIAWACGPPGSARTVNQAISSHAAVAMPTTASTSVRRPWARVLAPADDVGATDAVLIAEGIVVLIVEPPDHARPRGHVEIPGGERRQVHLELSSTLGGDVVREWDTELV